MNSEKNKSLKVKKNKSKIPKKNFVSMLKQLRSFISGLKDKKNISTWQDYSKENSYKIKENAKFAFFANKQFSNVHVLQISKSTFTRFLQISILPIFNSLCYMIFLLG